VQFEAYRRSMTKVGVAVVEALETMTPTVLKAGADELPVTFDTDDALGDLKRILSAMINFATAEHETLADARKVAEQELKWARQARGG
jgi:hypothetical protein